MYFRCLLPSRFPRIVGRMKFLFGWTRMVMRFVSLNCDGIRHQVIEDLVLSITRPDMDPAWGVCRPGMDLEVPGLPVARLVARPPDLAAGAPSAAGAHTVWGRVRSTGSRRVGASAPESYPNRHGHRSARSPPAASAIITASLGPTGRGGRTRPSPP